MYYSDKCISFILRFLLWFRLNSNILSLLDRYDTVKLDTSSKYQQKRRKFSLSRTRTRGILSLSLFSLSPSLSLPLSLSLSGYYIPKSYIYPNKVKLFLNSIWSNVLFSYPLSCFYLLYGPYLDPDQTYCP